MSSKRRSGRFLPSLGLNNHSNPTMKIHRTLMPLSRNLASLSLFTDITTFYFYFSISSQNLTMLMLFTLTSSIMILWCVLLNARILIIWVWLNYFHWVHGISLDSRKINRLILRNAAFVSLQKYEYLINSYIKKCKTIYNLINIHILAFLTTISI